MLGANIFLNSNKRPKLLAHKFNIERQNLLLLNTNAPSSSLASVSVVTNQSLRLKQFSDFLDSLSCSDCDGEWNLTIFNGIELLLRAVRSIKISSPSKQNLLLKLYKFKLKLLLLNNPIDFLALEECFNFCIDMNSSISIESFEEYFGIHPELDALLGEKLLQFSVGFSFKEKVKLCLEYKMRGGKDRICKELVNGILKDLKAIKENELKADIIILLLDLVAFNFDSELFSDFLVTIYQSNRKEFLDNSRIFDKFIEIIRNYLQKEGLTSANLNSFVTMLNSKIRSFLGRPEAKSDTVLQSCMKFVLEFQRLNIGCIAQFGDFLVKCQLMKLEDCSRPTRLLLYKLLRLSPSSVASKFIENLTNNDLKYEFVNDMLSPNLPKDSCNSYWISIFSDYFDEEYLEILEKYFKLIIGSEVFIEADEFDDDFITDLLDDSVEVGDSKSHVSLLVPDESLLTFLNGVLLPAYMKKFKSFLKSSENEDFNAKLPKLIATISYLLLNNAKITWTDLSSTLGPTAATSASKWNLRSIYCEMYTTLMKLIRNTKYKSLLRNILNPVNAAEYWTRCLLDLKEYGQIEFFNVYYGYCLSDRLECFKILNAPAKFTFELFLKTVDFKIAITSDWWIYLLSLGAHLIESASNLRGVICALFTKYIPINDFDLIIQFYQMLWRGIEKCTWEEFRKNRKDLLLKHAEMNGSISNIIRFIKKGDYSLSVFMSIYYEFMSGFMRNERVGFMIRLALISVSRSIIRNPEYRIILSESILRRTETDYLRIYQNLFLLTELRLIPENVDTILSELCEECELEYPEQFIKLLSKYQETNVIVPVATGIIENLTMKPSTQLITLRESFFMLSTMPTAFNCLSQLMKLLRVTLNFDLKNELDEFIGYMRKQKGSKDDYFNILFIE